MKHLQYLFTFIATSLIASTAIATPTNGPEMHHLLLDPGTSMVYAIEVEGASVTTLEVVGSGDGGDVDCRVFAILKGDYHLIVEDDADSDTCEVQFTSSSTRTYLFSLVNRGRNPSVYHVLVK